MHVVVQKPLNRQKHVSLQNDDAGFSIVGLELNRADFCKLVHLSCFMVFQRTNIRLVKISEPYYFLLTRTSDQQCHRECSQ